MSSKPNMRKQNLLKPQEVETWIFDLDNTLYPVTKRLLAHIDEHMGSFVAKYLGISRKDAHQVQKLYFKKYGLTLRGLMLNDGLDLKGRKIIYTNASALHTQLVLNQMKFKKNTFEAIFDIQAANYVPKPAIESYSLLCKTYSIDPTRAAMIDDIARNLEPAAQLGMMTVWKKTNAEWSKNIEAEIYIDHVVDDLKDWLRSI